MKRRRYTVLRVNTDVPDPGTAVAPEGRYTVLGHVMATSASRAIEAGRRKFKVSRRTPLATDLHPDDTPDLADSLETPTPAESLEAHPGRFA